MQDDVLVNKAATVERCVARAREEFERDPATFATNFTRQDAAVLNIQRACKAVLDMRTKGTLPFVKLAMRAKSEGVSLNTLVLAFVAEGLGRCEHRA